MENEKITEEKEIEKLDMSKKPKEEISIFGFGILFKKFDRLIELQDRTNFLLSMIEKKIERLSEGKDLNRNRG